MMNFTQEQQQAIDYDEKKPLLVSAAAGSGKTAVLINRIYKRLISKKVEPENLLVMTFTNKAAMQMRQKLEAKLAEEMAATSDASLSERLRDLKKRIPLAKISTIHAFCLSIIKEYNAYLTDENGVLILDAQINNMSDTQRDIYLAKAIDDVLNFIYERLADWDNHELDIHQIVSQSLPNSSQKTELFNIMAEPVQVREWLLDFEELTFAFTENYTDQTMRDQIIQMLRQFKSLPYYEKTVISAFQRYQAESRNMQQSDFVEKMLKHLKQNLMQALLAIQAAKSTNYYLKASQGKINSKEAASLPDKLAAEENALQEISQILQKPTDNQEKWHMIFLVAKQLEDPIALKASSRTTQNALEKREFMALYEPNVLPVIALLNSRLSAKTAILERNHLTKIQPYFAKDLPDYEKSMQMMIHPLARFVEIIILSDYRYQQLKRRYHLIDFNDYEHLALNLLDQEAIAADIRQQYQEVYIDEYQDTNPIQEMIINRIKAAKVFMVGDLKQSIYRFRHADPGLFKAKLDTYQPYQDNCARQTEKATAEQNLKKGNFILLNKNFRSAETILQGINQLFTWFMHEETAEIEYDAKQKLTAGNRFLSEENTGKKRIHFQPVLALSGDFVKSEPSLDDTKTSKHENQATEILSTLSLEEASEFFADLKSIAGESESANYLLLEALSAVLLIKREIENNAAYKDFAILGRTNKICRMYSDVLAAFNIPVNGNAEKNYLDSLELRFLIQLFTLLDNAKQDIPLVAIMRSGIFNLPFNENELFLCKLLMPRNKYFHENIYAVGQMSEEEFIDNIHVLLTDYPQQALSAIYHKIIQFLNILSRLREKANWLSLSELLDEIFQIADYPNQLASLPLGRERLADIEKFQEWANQFEKEKGSGLHDFTNYLRKIQEKKLQVDDFDEAPVADNSVSVMTIHASKGLEYKHVILAGSNQKLLDNRRDSLFHFDPDLGFAAYTADAKEQMIYSNINLMAFQEAESKKLWAEEYRLLYVALTRAEEQLTILANIKEEKRNAVLRNCLLNLREEMNAEKLYALNSYAEIMMGFFVMQETKEKQTNQLLDYFTLEKVPKRGQTHILLNNFEIDLVMSDTVLNQIEKLRSEELRKQALSAQIDRDILAYRAGEQKKTIQNLLTLELTDEESRQNICRLKNLLTDVADPFSRAPAKITVTELKRHETDTETSEMEIFPVGMADMGYTLRKPDLQRKTLQGSKSGVEFGTFIHTLMYFLSLKDYAQQPRSLWRQIYDRQIEQLMQQHKIRFQQKEMADYAYLFIEKFLASDLARRIIAAEEQKAFIYREVPFTLSIPLSDTEITPSEPLPNQTTFQKPVINNLDSSEQTLLQGMIDLWFMEGDRAVLVDYKSDFIPDEDKLSVLKQRYTVQLKYYALAIEKILDLKEPVKEKCIWLLREGKAYYL